MPCLERDKDEKSRTAVDVQPFLYQNAAKERKTTTKTACSHNVYNARGLEESRRVCYDGKKHKGGAKRMNSEQRRKKVLSLLTEHSSPLGATAIAKQCGVSRQIIVGDVALLRASGEQISATPRGYLLHREQGLHQRVIACRHTQEQMEQELYIVVDNGCAVLDVTVEHPVYGQISGQLQLFSRYDVDQFVEKLRSNNAPALCTLTGGVHLHNIQYQHQEDMERVVEQLREQGLLFCEENEGVLPSGKE